MSAKARSNLNVLRLPFIKIQVLRGKNDDLDKILGEYETYLDENSLPYCDYKLYQSKHLNIPLPPLSKMEVEKKVAPKEKFQYGVKRIVRIVQFYRTTEFADLMEIINYFYITYDCILKFEYKNERRKSEISCLKRKLSARDDLSWLD